MKICYTTNDVNKVPIEGDLFKVIKVIRPHGVFWDCYLESTEKEMMKK